MSESKPGTIYEDGRLEEYLDKGIDGTSSVGLSTEEGESLTGGGASTGEVYFADFDHIAHKNTMSVEDRLQEFVLEAKLADELGFDYYFTAEHHFSQDFSLSVSQALTCAILAQETEQIRFGPMTVILPIADPLRVAEEFTIIDHLSGGRLEMGVGRGVVMHELATYGRRNADGPALFRENLEFLIKCWTNDKNFSWNGAFNQYFDVEMPWKPLQQPYPRIWIPTATPDNAKEWGRRGYGVAGFSWLGIDIHEAIFAAYQEGWQESGLPVEDQRIAYLSSFVVADTDAEAEKLAKKHFPEQVELFEYEEGRSHWFGDTNLKRVYSGLLNLFAQIKNVDEVSGPAQMIIYGSPETVAQKMLALRAALPINTYFAEFSFGHMPWDTVRHSMELFASEVMPRVREGHRVAVTT
jgi:alkanesulfonate monooxygenase SsuD/methylene tetrahydromethanopterin reductase-like flavin-dependent oxidoreductase (luciferase family)